MKGKAFAIAGLVAGLSLLIASVAAAAGQADVAAIRAATAKYRRLDVAKAAGYGLVPGLDYCFTNPAGGMGYHYINTGMLDLTVNPLRPEALVYHSSSSGGLQLGAVEYLIPISLWDRAHPNGPAPRIFGMPMERDAGDGVYERHVWLWTQNPSGIFQDWNPKVTCP